MFSNVVSNPLLLQPLMVVVAILLLQIIDFIDRLEKAGQEALLVNNVSTKENGSSSPDFAENKQSIAS